MTSDLNIFILAFILSFIAGLSTGLGGFIALFVKKTNTMFLVLSLGFSAGVMIYISMIKIFSEANLILNSMFGEKIGSLYTIFGFFSGILIVLLINKFIPNDINLKEFMARDSRESKKKLKLMRTGLLTALAIAIHNFPEGIASFIVFIHSTKVAIPIILAIALHNIPEGISVSVPIYYATNDKKKALLYSFLSGMAEPLGAVFGFIVLIPFMNNIIFGLLYAVVAGIMVYISISELIPTSLEYEKPYLTCYGLITGMLFMAFSLWLFI